MNAIFSRRQATSWTGESPNEPKSGSGVWGSLIVRIVMAIICIAASFALTMAVPFLTRIEPRMYRVLAGIQLFYLLLAAIALAGTAYLLFRKAEIAVGIFYVIGFFKGDARLESSPIDLTIAVASFMIIAIGLRLVFTNQELRLPSAFFWYLPILFLMLLSLSYTPNLAAGLDKTLRFVFLTLLGAIVPFVLVNTPEKFKRFLATLVVGALLMSINSFFMLSGEDRLVAPSGETTALGFSAGLALIVIWTLWFPKLTLPQRLLFYPVIGVLAVALVGSGARLANVATAMCLLLSVLFCGRLVVDLGIIAGCGILALPFVGIPAASLQYLESLMRPHDAFGTRTDLMSYGVQIFLDHPLLGVGVQGYRYLTPNPLTYNFPHNLLLELGAELGVFAVIAFLAFAFLSFRELHRLLAESRFRDTALERTLLSLLILGALDVSVSGELNNDRLFFFLLSMPFILNAASAKYQMAESFHVNHMSSDRSSISTIQQGHSADQF